MMRPRSLAACYHLKDWLTKDPETADLVGRDMEDYINGPEMFLDSLREGSAG